MDRRRFLFSSVVAGAGALAGAGATAAWPGDELADRYHPDALTGEADIREVWYRYKFIDQLVMDTQLLFFLGLATSGNSDVGEVLDTSTRIERTNEQSWFDEWFKTATRVEGYGDEAFKAGQMLSAGGHYRRAGCYFRAGLIRYANYKDPRLVEASERSLALHDKALKLQGYDSEALEIRYDGGVMVARMHYAPTDAPAPTLLLHQGLHAWPEDTMWVIDGALRRGYHVLSFHGPGQGATLRLHGHPFRPDWEVPVGAVVDQAARDPRVDRAQLILMGLSFGGYLSARAASYDHRLRCLITNPGVLSWADSTLRHYRAVPGLMALHSKGTAAFNRAIDVASLAMPDAQWYFDDATWKHGVASPHALIEEMKRYDNTDGAPNIRCTTLIMESTGEDASPGESQRLFDALTCKKEMMVFDDSTASQVHCQGGNNLYPQARLFDWLGEELR